MCDRRLELKRLSCEVKDEFTFLRWKHALDDHIAYRQSQVYYTYGDIWCVESFMDGSLKNIWEVIRDKTPFVDHLKWKEISPLLHDHYRKLTYRLKECRRLSDCHSIPKYHSNSNKYSRVEQRELPLRKDDFKDIRDIVNKICVHLQTSNNQLDNPPLVQNFKDLSFDSTQDSSSNGLEVETHITPEHASHEDSSNSFDSPCVEGELSNECLEEVSSNLLEEFSIINDSHLIEENFDQSYEQVLTNVAVLNTCLEESTFIHSSEESHIIHKSDLEVEIFDKPSIYSSCDLAQDISEINDRLLDSFGVHIKTGVDNFDDEKVNDMLEHVYLKIFIWSKNDAYFLEEFISHIRHIYLGITTLALLDYFWRKEPLPSYDLPRASYYLWKEFLPPG